MRCGQVVNVLGFNVTGEECVVLVRAGGEYLPATCLPLDPALAAYVASMGLELVHLQAWAAQFEPCACYSEHVHLVSSTCVAEMTYVGMPMCSSWRRVLLL